MRSPWLALGAVLLVFAVRAEQPVPAPASRRLGYAFDYPRVLAQQRLFGIAHGISLLAAACRDMPEFAAAAQDSYAAWQARQQPTIAAATAELGMFYFGDDRADEPALARTLGLRDALGYAPEAAACATLPQALGRPRYDLADRFRLEELMARIVAAVEIEARDRHCRKRFTSATREIHAARYALWREINAPAWQQANATLAREWPENAPAATFADWLSALRRETKAGGSLTECLDFSQFLKRPESALRNVFRLPPAPSGTKPK